MVNSLLGYRDVKKGLAELSIRQGKLDQKVLDRFPELENSNRLLWKVPALIVEMGECLQEWRGFKKWSVDREVKDVDDLLEEYVDWLHFLLSVGNEINFDFASCDWEPSREVYYYEDVLSASVTEDMLEEDLISYYVVVWNKLFFTGLDINEEGKMEIKEDAYGNILYVFLAVGKLLGFTWENVYQGYMDKNKKNILRQESGY